MVELVFWSVCLSIGLCSLVVVLVYDIVNKYRGEP